MTSAKPVCSLSLDLDNQWSYMKTHGDSEWDSFPSYLDLVVPRFLRILDDFAWKITVFVVGQDAALEKNRESLQMIVNSAHEVGNHSFHHEPWLHLYSEQQTQDEIARAAEAIEKVTGQSPRGFRGPGYSVSRVTVEVLADFGYAYDASTFPTFIGPLARAYYFLTSDFTKKDKEQRGALFGGLKDGLRPVRPYLWDLNDEGLLEIPVTTMPPFKLPFHFSYLLYIGTFSATLAVLYFKAALTMCRAARVEPSLLLHPLDFLGGDDVSELAFFPAMKMAGAKKLALLGRFLQILSSRYSVLQLGTHAERLHNTAHLKTRSPNDLDR